MKVNLACKNILMSAILATGIVTSGAASAGLLTGAPSGWFGLVDDYSSGTPVTYNSVDTVDFFPTYSSGPEPAFDFTVSDEVTLATSFDIGFVSLSKTFDVDSISAGSTLLLKFDVDVFTSGSIDELFLSLDAGLLPGSTPLPLDLIPTSLVHPANTSFSVNADITAFAGLTGVDLSFSILDADVISDFLTISNLKIDEVKSVPEPSTILLFSLGIFAINRKKTMKIVSK